ncbi:Hypothetical protein A7982_06088 [Minicystis rosea]|nr:Hypothetical protein A7982_06088 [Minicystis rosea]
MKDISQDEFAKFATLVTTVWKDAKVAQEYQADPARVLSNYGITLPAGVPAPVIPERPKGDLGTAWQNQSFDGWEARVLPLDPNGTATGIAISSLACIACPVSSFSSLSNG